MSAEGREPKYIEVYVSAALFVISALLLYVLRQDLGPEFPGIIAGGVLGLVSGIALVFLVYFVQLPHLYVEPEHDVYNKDFDDYYIHLRVRNTSWGFLGGGGAPKCRGTAEFGGMTCQLKWATRPEPFFETGAAVPRGKYAFRAGIPQSWLMELALEQDLWPGDVGVLDIAMRSKNDPNCYIHEAENYRAPGHKKNPLTPGEHPFIVRLKPAGRRSTVFECLLDNKGGNDPSGIEVKVIREVWFGKGKIGKKSKGTAAAPGVSPK